MVADYNKLKTNLNLIMHRLKLVEKKKMEQNSKARRVIAELITSNKVDRARIKVEQIVMQDYLIEAMDMIEQFCDLILSRFGQLKASEAIDEGLEAAIVSLLWVAPRLESEVSELKTIADQLTLKYGKKYAESARANEKKLVNESLMKKMCVQPPSRLLIENYLVEIARDQKVDYKVDPRVLKEHESSLLGSNSDTLSDEDNSGGQIGTQHAGFNLIDLGAHYPINPITNPFSSYATAPSMLSEDENLAIPGGRNVCILPTISNDQIGFNLDNRINSTLLNADEGNITKKTVQHNQGVAQEETSNDAIPPHYDTVVEKSGDSSHYYSFSEHSRSRDNLNDTLPELPPVPKDLTDSGPNQEDQDALDFDLLTKRFEELKSKKP